MNRRPHPGRLWKNTQGRRGNQLRGPARVWRYGGRRSRLCLVQSLGYYPHFGGRQRSSLMDLSPLENKIKKDILHVHLPDGSVHSFGETGREAHWYFRRKSALRRIASDAAFELGQTYMEEGWDTGGHSLRDLLHVLRTNFDIDNRRWYQPLVKLYRKFNHIGHSYKNIASHYDLDEFVFRHFLDPEM